MKKKIYESPAVKVREVDLDSSLLAASTVTTVKAQVDDDGDAAIEDAVWSGLTITKSDYGQIEDASWSNN